MESELALNEDSVDPTDKVPMMDGFDVTEPPAPAPRPRRMALGTITPPFKIPTIRPITPSPRPNPTPNSIPNLNPIPRLVPAAQLPPVVVLAPEPQPAVLDPMPPPLEVHIEFTQDIERQPLDVLAIAHYNPPAPVPTRSEWEDLALAIEGQIAVASDEEQIVLYEQLAEAWEERFGGERPTFDPWSVTDEAPGESALLHRVVSVYADTKQWFKALEAIERFVAFETDAFRKGVCFQLAATLCRDQLNELGDAIGHYNRALDCFFAEPARLDEQQLRHALGAFAVLDAVLARQDDWKGLERAYRDMIERLAKCTDARFDALRVGLLDGLGEIYRSRLRRYEDAAEIFEAAQHIDPDSQLRPDRTDRIEILTQLYVEAGPDQADKAIERHVRLIQREPFRYESYKALARVYRSTQQHDKRWCVCNALAFLNKADRGEQHFYEQYKPRTLPKAQHPISPDSWAKLAHTDENRDISAIFAACWDGVAVGHAHPHKDFGFRREDRRQLEGDQLMFSKLFLYVAKTLNVKLPEIYLMDDDKAVDIQLANAIDNTELCPAFAVRPQLLQGKTEREIAFLSARRLAFMRPAYYLRMLLSVDELEIALLSALALAQPDFATPADKSSAVQPNVKKLRKRLPAHSLGPLGAAVDRFIKAGPVLDLAKWCDAVDATSHRVGLVVCGDLEASARAIANDSSAAGTPQLKDRVKELVLFSISEAFFAIRAQLGVVIAA